MEGKRCIQKFNAKRIVIDCLDALDLDMKDSIEFRKTMLELVMILKSLKCTCLLIAESHRPRTIIDEEIYDREFVSKWCYGFDRLRERAREYQSLPSNPEIVYLIALVHQCHLSCTAFGHIEYCLCLCN
jgi:hypothetical protein